MRSVKKLAFALTVCGLSATSAWAQSGPSFGGYPPSAPSAPSLLPLPDLNAGLAPGQYPVVQSANYSSAQPEPVLGPSSVAQPRYAPGPGGPPNQNEDIYGAALGCNGGNCGNGGCSGSACGNFGTDCGCCGGWFVYTGGLIMTRDRPNPVFVTYNQANNADQVLSTAMASPHFEGGEEVTFGRFCGCDCGWEATYWGIQQLTGHASVTDPNNNLGTPIDTTNGGVLINGQPADSFYTNSHQSLLWRDDQVNNVEVNFLYNPCGGDNCACVRNTWLAGVRFFEFDENLLWTTVASGHVYGDDGGMDQANFQVRCKNYLVGFQLGDKIEWRINDCFSIYGLPTFGIYGNHCTSDTTLWSCTSTTYDIRAAKDIVSFIGQCDLGATWDINCHWAVTGGYRVVAVSGIALSDNQFPAFLAATGDLANVKTNGDLVLHGAFAGVTFRW